MTFLALHPWKYPMSTRLGCKGIEIRKSEFAEKTQFIGDKISTIKVYRRLR